MLSKLGTGSSGPRVLLLSDSCNPEWPSLPSVGYNAVRAISSEVDATVVTHVRNRAAIEARNELRAVQYLDTEFMARPMYKLSSLLRGDERVGCTTAARLQWPTLRRSGMRSEPNGPSKHMSIIARRRTEPHGCLAARVPAPDRCPRPTRFQPRGGRQQCSNRATGPPQMLPCHRQNRHD